MRRQLRWPTSTTMLVCGRGKVIVGGATAVKSNVMASDGVSHVINKVLVP